MKWTEYLIPTLKETPSDAEISSHKLMLRAGLISKLSSGLYTFLPLGQRVLKKVIQIVREEMDNAGALEVLMPGLQPKELWERSGRWSIMADLMLKVKDRAERDFVLGPTHEEVVTDLVATFVKSYRELPKNIYQIQTKFRDELRPRFGLMRAREFIMKDAYSFDVDSEKAIKSYQNMYDTYQRIFKRCGLATIPVLADTGVMGGLSSHEFMVLADSGEDEIFHCSHCGYTANRELAARLPKKQEFQGLSCLREKVHTPNLRSVDSLTQFLKKDPRYFIKTMIYMTKNGPIAALCRGDNEINESKLAKIIGSSVQLVSTETIFKITKSPYGFTGPIDIEIPIYADIALKDSKNMICGANEMDHHFIGVDIERDVKKIQWGDIGFARVNDQCVQCQQALSSMRGIEIGHVFLLGTKYSEAMDAKFLAQDGKKYPCVMGCYGIGVTRLIAAFVETNYDDKGIIWSKAIAPYHIHIIPLNMEIQQIKDTALELYSLLQDKGFEVLLDDRDDRAGVKFNDADLIGIPIQIILGQKNLQQNIIEIKDRISSQISKIDKSGVVGFVSEFYCKI